MKLLVPWQCMGSSQMHKALTNIYVGFAAEYFRSLDQETTKDQSIEGTRLMKIRTMLDALFMDPWFTSLWTLQEAFLCPHAYLLSREAAAPLNTLAHLCHWCCTIDKLCDALNTQLPDSNAIEEFETHRPWAPNEKCLWEIKSMLRDRGLVALSSRNPMALYAAASYRKTRNEVDRVYAIQQVFGLRLGSSAPGFVNQPIHLVMLEFELGARMLENYPVLSQMHVFNEPVEPSRGWKISMSSRIPNPGLKQNLADFQYVSVCSLTTQRASHLQWGFFSGKVCHFKDICKAWTLTSPPSETSADASVWRSPQWIALDRFHRPKKLLNRYIAPAVKKLGSNTWEIKDLAVSDLPQYLPTGEEQHKFASLIVQRMDEWYKDKQLFVLYLGKFLGGPNHDFAHRFLLYRVGLILLESEYEGIPFHDFHGVTYWRRLGFCIWTCGYSSDELDTSEDKITANNLLTVSDGSPQWRKESGLFG